MKNLIYTILLVCGILNLNAQTVQATIKKISKNCIVVYAKSSDDIFEPPSNFLITLSVPDQIIIGETNPTPTVTNILAGMKVDEGNPPPYILNDRHYINLNFTPSITSPVALRWTADIEYDLATICFNENVFRPFEQEKIQLNDLTASKEVNNAFSYWYFELQGSGDVTNYVANFYDDDGMTAVAINGGDSQVENTELVILPISNDQLGRLNIEVYPNPSSETVFIHPHGNILEFEEAELNIYSSQGKLVKNTSLILNSNNPIDISALNNGTYLFFIKHGLKKYKKKFIKLN